MCPNSSLIPPLSSEDKAATCAYLPTSASLTPFTVVGRARANLDPNLAVELAPEFRRLLRRRLRVLAGLYEIGLFYLFVAPGILQIETGHSHGFDATGFAIGTVIGLSIAGLGAWLWKHRLPSLKALRRCELLLHGGFVLFVASWQYDEFIRLPAHPLWRGEYEEILLRSFGYANSVNWFVLLVVYGLLIPNTWQRCAGVSLATSLVPLLLHVLAMVYLGAESGMKLLLGSATAFAFANGLAIFGAFNIRTLQHEVKVIRQQVRALGQYQLKRRLGGGSMGEVYLAEHALLKRLCAVKFIRPELTMHAGYLARFEREVQAMAHLTHPNVIEVYDYGRSEDGIFYYAMEYLPGLDLQQLIERAGPLPPGRAVYLLRQMCAGLRAAHANGLIHRDIKPGNILIAECAGSADFVKLLDFGLVRGLEEVDSRLTQTGLILGTPGYMSPQQAAGEAVLDARTDIYSIGAVTYFLLSGQTPFADKTPWKRITAHILESPRLLAEFCPDIPDDLNQVVVRCLAREVGQRFSDAGQLEQAFAACACAADWSEEQAAAWWRSQPADDPLVQAKSGNLIPRLSG
jgi:tRNA A-37 threonylcarbamoyl transferase component Bud32